MHLWQIGENMDSYALPSVGSLIIHVVLHDAHSAASVSHAKHLRGAAGASLVLMGATMPISGTDGADMRV